ncbi:MAG: MATE family efflux transporter [Bacteroidaceae bacterium]|nr:MATE family efflux transporter [Bacteroidaceae bacterium]
MRLNRPSRYIAILRLAIPIVIAQLGSILQGWADTIMVGQYGTPELSAAGFVNNVFNLCIYFLLGISYATTPIVGSLFSQRKYGKVWQTLRESNVVNLLASLVVMLCLYILYLNIDALGQPQELLPLIQPYFIVLLLSLPFLALFNSMKQFSDALGNTKTPMWVMIGGNVVNIILNYRLIFLLDMGLLGAGIATLISRALMAIAIWMLIGKRTANTPQSTIPISIAPSRQGMLSLFRLGLPISVQLCLEASSFNVSALFMGWLGATALAAHQVMGTVCTLAFMVVYGIGAAAAIRIAHYRGVGEWNEVRHTAQAAFILSCIIDAILVTVICLAGRPIAHIFTTSHEVTALFLSFLPALICYQIGDCMQIIYANALRAIESVKAMMLYAVIAYVFVSIPLAYIFAFPLRMGAVGIWWSFPFGLTTAGLCYYFQFRRQVRQRTS